MAVDTFLESRVCHISFSTLWNCLLEDNEHGDKQWEAILYEAAIDEGSSSSNEAYHAIHMRLDILWGLQQQYKSGTLDSNDTENTMLSLRGIPRVYKTAMALSSYTDKLDKVRHHTNIPVDNQRRSHISILPNLLFLVQSLSGSARQSVIEFVSCHFSLLLAAFSSYTKDLAVHLHVNDDIIASRRKKRVPTLESHSNDNNVSRLSDLITKCSHGSCTDNNVDVSSIDTVLEILKEQLLIELEKTEDYSMTCQLVDLLAMLTMHFDHNKACKCIVDATKEALGSVYSSNHANVDLPYLLFKIDHTVRNTNDARLSVAKIPFSRLLQSANTLIKTKDSSTSAFIHHLLSHWSALVLCGSSQYRFLAETSQAVGDVIAFSCHTDSKQSDGRARISNQLPMLNKKMCIPVFELLMQMITASLSLAHPIRIRKVNQDPSQNENTPYEEIISLLVAFDKMLRLFRAHRLHFNQRVFFGITKASLLVIKLGIYQLQDCVNWRTSQPLSLNNLDGNDDPAAASLLQPLLDALSANCIGSISSFCRDYSVMTPHSRNGLSYKHSRAIATLRFKCKGLKDLIINTCKAHGFEVPKVTQLHNGNKDSFVKHDDSMKRSLDTPSQTNKRHRNDSSSVLEQLNTIPNAPTSDSSDDEDNSLIGSDDDGGSFGVMGDWG